MTIQEIYRIYNSKVTKRGIYSSDLGNRGLEEFIILIVIQVINYFLGIEECNKITAVEMEAC